MELKKLSISDLIPADYNPRKDLIETDSEFISLERSISEFGYVLPVIYNELTGRIIGGHQRIKVLKKLGYSEIDVVCLSLDEQREKELNIALNKIDGQWDNGTLEKLFEEFESVSFDSTLTGFSEDEIGRFFDDEIKETTNLQKAAPSEDTTVRFGFYKFVLTKDEYERLVAHIRINTGFVKDDIIAELRRRLTNGL